MGAPGSKPLNEALYSRLKQVFGGVSIINPGRKVKISFDYRPRIGEDTVVRWWVPEGEDKGEQYAVRCPYCKDRGRHLYISHTSLLVPNVERGVAEPGKLLLNCFHGCFVNRPERYAEVKHKLSITEPQPIHYEVQEEQQSSYSDKLTLNGIRTWAPNYSPLSSAPPEVIKYISERRYTPEYLSSYGVGWGPVASYSTGQLLNNGNPFLIIPFVQNGKLRGFQARACMSKTECEKRNMLRYYIHPGCRKSSIIYNIDKASQSNICVLTEGVFGVLRIGHCGIATFGPAPSAFQEKLMAARWSKGALIWVPDTVKSKGLDPIEKAREICQKYNDRGIFAAGAHVVVLDSKDPDETTTEHLWEQIYAQAGTVINRLNWRT